MANESTERDKIPPTVRHDALSRDGYTCQVCGVKGPKSGGVATLQVHHKQSNPENGDRHDLNNLITLCEDCHSWIHKRPTGEQLPFEITAADRKVLLPHDYQILQVLHESGPLSTGEIQEALSLELSASAIRERLWLMMGLDNEVASRKRPLIDQDATSGEWGLPNQIAESERGRIPDDMQTLIRRVHDERVRRALERGCDRSTIADVFGIAERTSWHKQRRAQAYDFPLGGIERGEEPSPTNQRTEPSIDADETSDSQDAVSGDGSHDGQQRLDSVGETDTPENDTSPVVDEHKNPDDSEQVSQPSECIDNGSGEDSISDGSTDQKVSIHAEESIETASLQNHVEQAIAALKAIEETIEGT